MYRALVVKELRESAGLIALGLLASAFFLASLTRLPLLPFLRSGYDQSFPFASDPTLAFDLWLIVGGLAIVLGLKQSAWELWHDSYHFLLHRPVDRRRVFGTKLAVGSGVVLLVSAAFVVVYAVWAALPGRHASPFFWSMTAGSWQLAFSLLLLYFAAFLSGIRPGRWFGSRLVPLVAAVPIVTLAANLPWWWISVVTVVLAAAAYVVSILLYVQSRDY